MQESKNEKYTLTHSGDHHLAKAQYDPETKRISAGGIYSFSDNSAVSMNIVDNEISGSFLHSGDTHNLKVDVHKDGSFEGVYEDKKNSNLKIGIKGGKASLISGKVPVNGIEIEADHHSVKFNMGENDQISGQIESKADENNSFKIKLDKGKVSGSMIHCGSGHKNSFEIFSDGKWKASISAGDASSNISFDVANGNTGLKAFAGLKFNF